MCKQPVRPVESDCWNSLRWVVQVDWWALRKFVKPNQESGIPYWRYKDGCPESLMHEKKTPERSNDLAALPHDYVPCSWNCYSNTSASFLNYLLSSVEQRSCAVCKVSYIIHVTCDKSALASNLFSHYALNLVLNIFLQHLHGCGLPPPSYTAALDAEGAKFVFFSRISLVPSWSREER